MTLVDFSSASSNGAVRYFVFIVCICLFLFFFLVVRLAGGLAPEIYNETPGKPVYRAQHSYQPPMHLPASSVAPRS